MTGRNQSPEYHKLKLKLSTYYKRQNLAYILFLSDNISFGRIVNLRTDFRYQFKLYIVSYAYFTNIDLLLRDRIEF
jgi:hypothetical protein